MSETGGGHRAAAEAISEALDHLYGKAVTVSVVDAWKHHVAWPLNSLASSYHWFITTGDWLWQSFWLLQNRPQLVQRLLQTLYPLVAPGLWSLFKAQQADVIVSVHPLITFFPLLVLRRHQLNTPFVTVMTDLIKGYPAWFQPQTTLCLVPTQLARRQALGLGLAPNQVEVVGQPVGLKFATASRHKAHLRAHLGLELHRPTVLLSGGGEGYGPIFEIARSIAQRTPPAQLLIVTGRNQALYQKLQQYRWEIPTKIYSFVDNMPELMGAADILVSKAGPGTLSEAFMMGLPVIIFGYIPGQEEENVAYVQSHQAGRYIPDPVVIAQTLTQWFQPGNTTLRHMADQSAQLARPEAALKIAQRVYQLIAPTIPNPPR
jgi:1,2-diacylglycerol 3-beta-galactosyltransferase